ncbi:hypothetical protein RJ640_023327, partial [Escallonia rubra]
MRFGFNSSSPEPNIPDRSALTPPSSSSSAPKEELQWLPLRHHPAFSAAATNDQMPRNLMAWDGASRLYFWDSHKQCLHRISVRLGEPDPASILAASPSKVLQPDEQLGFVVNKISINRNGSALLLAGTDGLCVMYLYGRTSTKDNTLICRIASIGSEIYFNTNNIIRTLQILWHPYSDSHLGILSSDSVFRLFDLSAAIKQLEQEYFLEPMTRGRSKNAASICPVDFSFGGDHLWDRFSVFVLYSDGSVYVLCPVVPFGSVYKWESISEIYIDAHTFGLKSANSKAVSNSNLAISWLEATFPELTHQPAEGGNIAALKAQAHPLLDASISLQGPLRRVCQVQGKEEEAELQAAECEGRAVSFLYSNVSKDSVLVTAWSGGQLQIDALADEIQPVWSLGNRPHFRVDPFDSILGVAMICEPRPNDLSIVKLDQPPDQTVWLGHPPPLLRLAIVDLALPGIRESNYHLSMFVDPLIPERIYAVHNGGIDSVVLHFLPFTRQISGNDETMRTPSVYSVLSTCQGESSSPPPLCGFVPLADSFGWSWIVGLTSSGECIVLELETWNSLLPIHVLKEKNSTSLEGPKAVGTPTIISKELLGGPKIVLVPPSSPNLRSVAADSIDGRQTLHQYFKLFHENYVEYAHKVYFELEHHGPHLKKIIDDQHSRLREAQQKLSKVEQKQEILEDRIDRAIQFHSVLEERLQSFRNLLGVHKKPLSKAEQEFKSQLDRFNQFELDALRSSIGALNARLKRYTSSLQSNIPKQQRQISGRRKNYVQDDEISQLRSSVAKLSLLNTENTKKVKVVESAL